jgi:hypothetical protein
MLARIKDRNALERENRDLRRRLGSRASAPAAGTSSMLYSSVLPAGTPAPAQAPVQRTAMPPTLAPSTPASGASELANRVGTMEDRLGKIEEMLRLALTGSLAR